MKNPHLIFCTKLLPYNTYYVDVDFEVGIAGVLFGNVNQITMLGHNGRVINWLYTPAGLG